MNDGLLLLDSHCWLRAQLRLVDQLSRRGLRAIRRAESTGRITVPPDVRTSVREAFTKPGLSLAPLTPEIALESSDLPGVLHGDPADRILAATARILRATLLTKDQRLLDYSRQYHLRTLSA